MALEDAREAELAEEVGITYDIRHNVGEADNAARERDDATASAMLKPMHGVLRDDGVLSAPNPVSDSGPPTERREKELQRQAQLCAGSGIALDLGGAGYASLLGDEAAATGVTARSLDLTGLDGGAESSGAPRPADACIVPLAVCGEGRSGSLRLQWRRQLQRLNAAECEPDMRPGAPVGDGFVPLASLKPADASFAGLATRPCAGPCMGLAAEGLAVPIAGSPYRAPRDVVVFFDASSALTSMPLARRTFVAGLMASLNAAYAVDGDARAMQKAAAAIAKQDGV